MGKTSSGTSVRAQLTQLIQSSLTSKDRSDYFFSPYTLECSTSDSFEGELYDFIRQLKSPYTPVFHLTIECDRDDSNKIEQLTNYLSSGAPFPFTDVYLEMSTHEHYSGSGLEKFINFLVVFHNRKETLTVKLSGESEGKKEVFKTNIQKAFEREPRLNIRLFIETSEGLEAYEETLKNHHERPIKFNRTTWKKNHEAKRAAITEEEADSRIDPAMLTYLKSKEHDTIASSGPKLELTIEYQIEQTTETNTHIERPQAIRTERPSLDGQRIWTKSSLKETDADTLDLDEEAPGNGSESVGSYTHDSDGESETGIESTPTPENIANSLFLNYFGSQHFIRGFTERAYELLSKHEYLLIDMLAQDHLPAGLFLRTGSQYGDTFTDSQYGDTFIVLDFDVEAACFAAKTPLSTPIESSHYLDFKQQQYDSEKHQEELEISETCGSDNTGAIFYNKDSYENSIEISPFHPLYPKARLEALQARLNKLCGLYGDHEASDTSNSDYLKQGIAKLLHNRTFFDSILSPIGFRLLDTLLELEKKGTYITFAFLKHLIPHLSTFKSDLRAVYEAFLYLNEIAPDYLLYLTKEVPNEHYHNLYNVLGHLAMLAKKHEFNPKRNRWQLDVLKSLHEEGPQWDSRPFPDYIAATLPGHIAPQMGLEDKDTEQKYHSVIDQSLSVDEWILDGDIFYLIHIAKQADAFIKIQRSVQSLEHMRKDVTTNAQQYVSHSHQTYFDRTTQSHINLAEKSLHYSVDFNFINKLLFRFLGQESTLPIAFSGYDFQYLEKWVDNNHLEQRQLISMLPLFALLITGQRLKNKTDIGLHAMKLLNYAIRFDDKKLIKILDFLSALPKTELDEIQSGAIYGLLDFAFRSDVAASDFRTLMDKLPPTAHAFNIFLNCQFSEAKCKLTKAGEEKTLDESCYDPDDRSNHCRKEHSARCHQIKSMTPILDDDINILSNFNACKTQLVEDISENKLTEHNLDLWRVFGLLRDEGKTFATFLAALTKNGILSTFQKELHWIALNLDFEKPITQEQLIAAFNHPKETPTEDPETAEPREGKYEEGEDDTEEACQDTSKIIDEERSPSPEKTWLATEAALIEHFSDHLFDSAHMSSSVTQSLMQQLRKASLKIPVVLLQNYDIKSALEPKELTELEAWQTPQITTNADIPYSFINYPINLYLEGLSPDDELYHVLDDLKLKTTTSISSSKFIQKQFTQIHIIVRNIIAVYSWPKTPSYAPLREKLFSLKREQEKPSPAAGAGAGAATTSTTTEQTTSDDEASSYKILLSVEGSAEMITALTARWNRSLLDVGLFKNIREQLSADDHELVATITSIAQMDSKIITLPILKKCIDVLLKDKSLCSCVTRILNTLLEIETPWCFLDILDKLTNENADDIVSIFESHPDQLVFEKIIIAKTFSLQDRFSGQYNEMSENKSNIIRTAAYYLDSEETLKALSEKPDLMTQVQTRRQTCGAYPHSLAVLHCNEYISFSGLAQKFTDHKPFGKRHEEIYAFDIDDLISKIKRLPSHQGEVFHALNAVHAFASKMNPITYTEVKKPFDQFTDGELKEASGYYRASMQSDALSARAKRMMQFEFLALCRELYYRKNHEGPKFAYPEQLLPTVYQIISGKNHCFGIDTGQGKSISSILLAAQQWLIGRSVNICTATPELSKRDFDHAKLFFESLGADVNHIKKTSSFDAYKKAGVHFSSITDLPLFFMRIMDANLKMDTNLKGANILLDFENHAFIGDEFDLLIRLNNSFRLSVPNENPNRPGINPNAEVYPAIVDFIGSTTFREDSTTQENLTLLQQHLHARPDLQEKMAEHSYSEQDLKQWLSSAFLAMSLIKGHDYTVELDPFGNERVYVKQGRADTLSSYEKSVMSFLQARESCTITTESICIDELTRMGFLQLFARGRIIGFTATPATERDALELSRNFAITNIHIPRRSPWKVEVPEPTIVERSTDYLDETHHIAAIRDDIEKHRKKCGTEEGVPPVLIFVRDEASAKELADKLGLPNTLYDGNNSEQRHEDVTYKASRNGSITITIGSLMSRGENIATDHRLGLHEIITYCSDYTSYIQERGRTGRGDKPGKLSLIFSTEQFTNSNTTTLEDEDETEVKAEPTEDDTIETSENPLSKKIDQIRLAHDQHIARQRQINMARGELLQHIRDIYCINYSTLTPKEIDDQNARLFALFDQCWSLAVEAFNQGSPSISDSNALCALALANINLRLQVEFGSHAEVAGFRLKLTSAIVLEQTEEKIDSTAYAPFKDLNKLFEYTIRTNPLASALLLLGNESAYRDKTNKRKELKKQGDFNPYSDAEEAYSCIQELFSTPCELNQFKYNYLNKLMERLFDKDPDFDKNIKRQLKALLLLNQGTEVASSTQTNTAIDKVLSAEQTLSEKRTTPWWYQLTFRLDIKKDRRRAIEDTTKKNFTMVKHILDGIIQTLNAQLARNTKGAFIKSKFVDSSYYTEINFLLFNYALLSFIKMETPAFKLNPLIDGIKELLINFAAHYKLHPRVTERLQFCLDRETTGATEPEVKRLKVATILQAFKALPPLKSTDFLKKDKSKTDEKFMNEVNKELLPNLSAIIVILKNALKALAVCEMAGEKYKKSIIKRCNALLLFPNKKRTVDSTEPAEEAVTSKAAGAGAAAGSR